MQTTSHIAQQLPSVSYVSAIATIIEAHPFAAVVTVVIGWLIVQGIRAYRANGEASTRTS